MSSLTTPRFRVTRPDTEPFLVQVLNPDLVRWDRERAKRRWPGPESAPMLWMTYVAWAAARRTQAVKPDLDYAEWEETTEQIEMVDAEGNPVAEDAEQAAAVDPTQPDPGLT